MTDHCPACQIVRELTDHRDATATATEWSARRAALNFALVIAARACPQYVPVMNEEN